MGLLLEAINVRGDDSASLRWRWLLRDEETGNPLADHDVNLDLRSIDVTRFADLVAYTSLYASPDRRIEEGARYATLAGEWAGGELLGESLGAAIVAAAPVAVRVRLPEELKQVLLWPLELAHASGRPLASYGDVTLVYDIAPDATLVTKSDVGSRMRMLAVFSQPTETSVLALRRERYALTRLVRRIAARERAVVELQVVQYGATRERLREIADSGDGWDVLHLSGHGTSGAFLLEEADGSPDLVSTTDLVALLRPARRRVRLAVVSACESAADTTAQTLRLLGLMESADALEAERPDGHAAPIPGLARALVRELGCAVVAMRYPVTDEFAIAFGKELYTRLLSRTHHHTVGAAVARATAEAAGSRPTAARPAVSLVTPGVFGPSGLAALALPVPYGRPVIDPAEQLMAYFPDEPPRFVGRSEALAKAGAALAPDSGRTAVLLYGMAGAGKTACALELAYRHQDSFAAAAFWQAPTKDDQWAGAFDDVARRLEIQLARYGFTMVGHIGTVAALEAFLPGMRRAMAANGVLIVLDNLETLLTPEGVWRDDRWALLIATLTSHDGESRVIMTSRVVPVGCTGEDGASAVDGSPVALLPVHALSRDEALGLARELPNLRALLHVDGGPLRAAAGTSQDAEAERLDMVADRDRVRRVLQVVQGHPKLLELADAAAANRAQLDAQLAAADADAADGQLEAFFRDGRTDLDAAQFLHALAGWTAGALRVLPEAARLMAEFVAYLEDSDRLSSVIEANWADLWRRLGRSGDPPESRPLLDLLAGAALVDAEAAPGEPRVTIYRMHPGVMAEITAASAPGAREAVDAELAAFWDATSDWAVGQESREGSELVVRAGLAAAPYLLRRRDWDTASVLLERAMRRSGSPGMVQATLPAFRQIAAATGKPKDICALARVIWDVDPAEAEPLIRGALDAAVRMGDYGLVSTMMTDLVRLLLVGGKLAEALAATEEMAEYTQRAGYGPWTQLRDQVWRLQVLERMGEHAQVLAEVETLRAEMAGLPAHTDAKETIESWAVREGILDVGHSSALATANWQQCLELNAEIAASQRQRGAKAYAVTETRFNDASPLIQLGRLDEAERLLAECQQFYKDHADTGMLATVFSVRGRLQVARGNQQAAADLARTSLRLRYAKPQPHAVATGHHNLASDLARLGTDPVAQRAHRLGAALIRRLADMAHNAANTVRVLAYEMRGDDPAMHLPSTVAEVIAGAERTEGVRLASLLAALQSDPRVVEAALAEILQAAAALAGDSEFHPVPILLQWQPMIHAVATACQPGQAAPPALIRDLDALGETSDWAALVSVLRRILAGERDESELLVGLDPIDTTIAHTILTRLDAPSQAEP